MRLRLPSIDMPVHLRVPSIVPALCAAACMALAPHAALSISDRVERVVDGDTVVLSKLGRARLIGVDTPETVAPAQRQGAPPQCYGPEASARTRMLLPSGAPVTYEFDVEPTDRFGRSLVYLYGSDDTFINGALVRDGYARAKAYKPNVQQRATLEQLQAEAKAAGRGLWGSCADAKSNAGKGFDTARASAAVEKQAPARPPRTPAERKQREAAPPALVATELVNPGDTKNCADFASYAEAKAWFDLYFPRFGDVAKLDGNGDGRPCEGLMQKAPGRPVG